MLLGVSRACALGLVHDLTLVTAIHWRAAHAAVVAAGQVVQVGVLTMATWTIELLLERGLLYAAGSILAQIVQGADFPALYLGCSRPVLNAMTGSCSAGCKFAGRS